MLTRFFKSKQADAAQTPAKATKVAKGPAQAEVKAQDAFGTEAAAAKPAAPKGATLALKTPQAQRKLGAWYGLAVGDALGAPFEFMSAEQIAREAPAALAMSGGGIWDPGEWTDDTALTLAVAAAYQPAGFKPEAAAQAMIRWFNTDPKDIGILTRDALSLLRQGSATADSAGDMALARRPGSASNGSLMRALPTALVRPAADQRLSEETAALSRITHAESRCVAACIAFNTIVASLVANGGMVPQALAAGAASVDHAEVHALVKHVASGGGPRLVDEDGIGYVLLALERGLIALRDSKTFEKGVASVVRMGGDADTNAAIAGALLGARDGYSAIPSAWLQGLGASDVLANDFERLMTVTNETSRPVSKEHPMQDANRYTAMKPFLSEFKAPGFAIYENFTDPKTNSVYRRYTPTVQRFIEAATKNWSLPGFAWDKWRASDEGKSLLSSTAAIAGATPEQVQKMLTTMVRAERFSDGYVKGAIEKGWVQAVLERIEVLAQQG